MWSARYTLSGACALASGIACTPVYTIGYDKRQNTPAECVLQNEPPTTKNLLFAVPKKGRLHESIVRMLKGSGFDYSRPERLDIAHCKDLPISFVFLPASDIATYVGEGNVDLGITGEDIVAESEVHVEVLLKLGFGKCRLCVQAPVADALHDAAKLCGKRIVTSFPNVTKKYFESIGMGEETNIKCISGSVEAACGLGLADGIVDLVETGTTMRAAGLEEVSTIMNTQAILIANPNSVNHELLPIATRRIEGYLTANRYVMVTYNVHRSSLRSACRITPGKRSPTITSLDEVNWVSVSALVEKKKAAAVMDDLQRIGAKDVLTKGLLCYRTDPQGAVLP